MMKVIMIVIVIADLLCLTEYMCWCLKEFNAFLLYSTSKAISFLLIQVTYYGWKKNIII